MIPVEGLLSRPFGPVSEVSHRPRCRGNGNRCESLSGGEWKATEKGEGIPAASFGFSSELPAAGWSHLYERLCVLGPGAGHLGTNAQRIPTWLEDSIVGHLEILPAGIRDACKGDQSSGLVLVSCKFKCFKLSLWILNAKDGLYSYGCEDQEVQLCSSSFAVTAFKSPPQLSIEPNEALQPPLENPIKPLENPIKPLENPIKPLENPIKPL